MGEFVTAVSTILSFLSTLFFWGGLVLMLAMLRKVMKDIAELKRTMSALETTLMVMPRAAAERRVETPSPHRPE